MSVDKSNGSLASFLDDCVDDDMVIKHEHGERISGSTTESMDDTADSAIEHRHVQTSHGALELSLVLPINGLYTQSTDSEKMEPVDTRLDTSPPPPPSPTLNTHDSMVSITRDKPSVKKSRPKRETVAKRAKKPKTKTTARRGKKAKANMTDVESQITDTETSLGDTKTTSRDGDGNARDFTASGNHLPTIGDMTQGQASKEEQVYIACSVASAQKYQFLASNLPFGLAHSIVNNPLALKTNALKHYISVNRVLYDQCCEFPSTCKCTARDQASSNVDIRDLFNSLPEKQRSELICFIKHRLFV